MKKFLIISIITILLSSCSDDNPIEPKTENHTLKVKNYFDFNGQQQTNVGISLDGDFLFTVPYGSSKSKTGISSGYHKVEFSGGLDGFAGISFSGYGQTCTLTINSGGSIDREYTQ